MEARKRLVIVSILVLAAMLAASAWAWIVLPQGARVPIHWDSATHADNYAGKAVGLLTPPFIVALVTLLFYFLPRIEPRRAHLMSSSKLYGTSWLGVLALMAAAHAHVVLTATGLYEGPIQFPIAVLGVFLIVFGNYLGKSRSNFFIGIRTPWTLSSELSWQKTHRLGGRLFVVEGIAMVLAALAVPALVPPVVAGGLVGIVVIVVVYSFFVWRSDPARGSKTKTVAG